jgi:RimJ/RimL family protein N-acetyltransferase
MSAPFPLAGTGFALRLLEVSDAAAIAKNINEPSTLSKLSRVPEPYHLADAEAFIAQCRKDYETAPLNVAIDVEGEAVGCIGFSEMLPHRAEIGYWLASRHRGKGIAPGALRLMTEYGFGTLRLVRISAMVFAGNEASAHVLTKAGYTKEGYLKKQVQKNGQYLDVELYAKIREDA